MSTYLTNILVTGTNGGLGLGICLRLIDDFLTLHDASHKLNLIFTTRSASKGTATLRTLHSHLDKHSPQQRSRVTFQPETVDLTKLLSVRSLSQKLVQSDLSHLDTITCNAGIGGWSGMNWWRAVPDILLDIRNNTVWPEFKLGVAGSVTSTQISQTEPPLGEVFCANLFGHYMLIHYLMPLLRAAQGSKVIWVSSIEAQSRHFFEDDLVGIKTDAPYEHSKRATDLLVLTSNLADAQKSVDTFNSMSSESSRKRQDYGPPTQHSYHPGIVVTAVVDIPWIMQQLYPLGILLARLLGSPWSNVTPYAAAHAATWLALTSEVKIQQAAAGAHVSKTEDQSVVVSDGQVKWGTASSPLGTTMVRASEVDGWGIRGTGSPYAQEWWGGLYGGGKYGRGRRPDATEAQPEDVRKFIAQGSRLWTEMEALRVQWEQRIEAHEKGMTS